MKRKRIQHYQGYYSSTSNQQSRLENLFLRFPVLGKLILNKLDNKSLGTFKHVSRPINDFIVNEKVVWIRKILKHVGNGNELPEMWKKVLHHALKDKVRKLSKEVSEFYTNEVSECYPNAGPLVIATASGSASLCNFVLDKIDNVIDDINLKNDTVLEACHFAIGNLKMFKILYNHLSEKNPKDKNEDWTLLHYAIDDLQVFKYIFNIVEEKHPKSCEGWTPFHIAAKEGRKRVCKFICENMAEQDLMAKGNNGCTPFHVAAKHNKAKICKIMSNAVDPNNQIDDQGFTPLHYAANYGNVETCEVLLKKVEDPHPQDFNGWAPLHFAVSGNEVEVCKLFVKNVDNKHPRNNNGDSPLHGAVYLQNLELCKILFNSVEDELPRNNFHETPLDKAEELGYSEIVDYFKLFLTAKDGN